MPIHTQKERAKTGIKRGVKGRIVSVKARARKPIFGINRKKR